MDVTDLTDSLAGDLGYRKGVQGVVITRVYENSIALDNGLRRGTVITRIDNQRVLGTTSARQILQTANLNTGILLQVMTPQGGVSYTVVRNSTPGS